MNIPYQNMEIEQIYTQLLSNPRTSIAICSAEQGEGVTSLAFALAQRNLLAGHSTLLVDLNLYRPAIKNLLAIKTNELFDKSLNINVSQGQVRHDNNHHDSTTDLLSTPQLVCRTEDSIALNGVVIPTKRAHIMKLREPGVLERCITEWLLQYDTVIIDTSPLNRINAQNIPPERVASACDGAILMVLAGRTTEAAVNSAVAKLNNANALLLGCVFNDRDTPSLKDELLKETQRMSPYCAWLSRRLKNIINHSRLFTLEV